MAGSKDKKKFENSPLPRRGEGKVNEPLIVFKDSDSKSEQIGTITKGEFVIWISKARRGYYEYIRLDQKYKFGYIIGYDKSGKCYLEIETIKETIIEKNDYTFNKLEIKKYKIVNITKEEMLLGIKAMNEILNKFKDNSSGENKPINKELKTDCQPKESIDSKELTDPNSTIDNANKDNKYGELAPINNELKNDCPPPNESVDDTECTEPNINNDNTNDDFNNLNGDEKDNFLDNLFYKNDLTKNGIIKNAKKKVIDEFLDYYNKKDNPFYNKGKINNALDDLLSNKDISKGFIAPFLIILKGNENKEDHSKNKTNPEPIVPTKDMSRLEISSIKPIRTMQFFSKDYRNIIREKDKSFYNENKGDLKKFEYVIQRYTGNDYLHLNNYLRDGIVGGDFTKEQLESWTYCLHSAIQLGKPNVKNNTVVYRGVSLPASKEWKEGYKFYFREFVSASLDKEEAKKFSKGVTLMVITLKNIGVKGRTNYCRYIGDISNYPGEEEVLITAFCIYKITKIEKTKEGTIYYIDCEGY